MPLTRKMIKRVSFDLREHDAAEGLLKLKLSDIPCFVKAHRYKKIGISERFENTCCVEFYIEWLSGRFSWENASLFGKYKCVRDYSIAKLPQVWPILVASHRLIGDRLDVYIGWSNGEYSWNIIDSFPTAPIVETYLAKCIGIKNFRE